MSGTLCWRPVKKSHDESFGVGIRNIITEKFGQNCTLGVTNVEFFEGVAAGAGDGELHRNAKRIAELLQQHGEIDFWVEH